MSLGPQLGVYNGELYNYRALKAELTERSESGIQRCAAPEPAVGRSPSYSGGRLTGPVLRAGLDGGTPGRAGPRIKAAAASRVNRSVAC